MAGYTRQSTFADGDTITAALFNNEYNQLLNAFSNTGGHKHDGTAAEGPVIGLIGDAGETSPNNKVLIDTTNNYIEFYVEVSSSSVQQLYIADGAIIPVTDSDIDLGTTSLRFKDTYTDTVTTTGNVSVGGNLTVTGTTTFNGGTITMGDAATDNVVFGADVDSHIIPDDDDTYDLGSSTQQWRNLYIDGTAEIDTLAINGTTVTSTAAELNILDGVTSTAAELNLLDGVTSTTAELNILDGVTATAAEINLLDGVTSTTAELNILDGVTATSTEINILDGVTSTTAELNILDGVTANATEINLLDGVTSTTAELNILDGVTSTAAELNLLDGKAFLDEDNMASNSATGIASQQSIKAYVDAQVTAQDLDIITDSGTIAIDLDSENLTISGGTGLDSSATGDAVTLAIDSTVTTLSGTQTLLNKTLTSPDVNTPDIDGGTIDGATIATSDVTVGAGKTLDVSAGTITLADNQISGDKVEGGTIAATTITDLTFGSLNDGTITATAFVDEDNMASNSATLIPTQQSVKAYVDAQVTAQDLDFQGDSGGALSIDLDSESLTIAGGTGIDTSGATNTLTVAIDSTVATLTGSQTLTNKSLTAPTLTGTAVVASLDISGDIDVDGTTNLDVVDIDGAVDMASTLTVTGAAILNGGIDVAGEIVLDADGGNITLKDGGTSIGQFQLNDSNHLKLVAKVSDADIFLQGNDGGSVITALRLDMSDAGTATFNHDVILGDGGKAIFGAGSDLQIYHDAAGGHSRIDDTGTGNLVLRAASALVVEKYGGDTMANFSNDGAVTLYYDNEAKIATTLTGIDVTGTVVADGLTVDTSTLVVDATNNRVGIGTASPSSALETVGGDGITISNSGDTFLQLKTTGTTATNYIEFKDSGGAAGSISYNHTDNYLAAKVNGTERMRIDSSGNVGIGTSDPKIDLDVVRGGVTGLSSVNARTVALFQNNLSNGAVISVNAPNTGYSGIFLGDPENESQGQIKLVHTDNSLQFTSSGGAAEMTLKAGNLGIGTTSPSTTLDVLSSSNQIISTFAHPSSSTASVNGGALVRIQNTNATNGNQSSLIFADSSAGASSGIFGFNTNHSTHEGYMVFGTRNSGGSFAERMRITAAGAIEIKGSSTTSQAQGFITNDNSVLTIGSSVSGSVVKDIAFASPSTMMYIDGSTGNVGIGETSPLGKLHVKTGDSGAGINVNADELVVESSGTAGITILSGTTGDGNIFFDDSGGAARGKLSYSHNGDYLSLLSTGASIFYNGGSEAMRIDSSGNAEIGGVTNAGSLKVINTSAQACIFDRRGSDGTVVLIRNDDTNVGSISVSGSSTAYNTSSDYRLKENVDYTWDATTRLKQLKPARFNFITDETNTLVDGFLAHEVSSVVPEAILGTKDAVDSDGNPKYQGIDQSKLVPLLVKTIQELEERITALES